MVELKFLGTPEVVVNGRRVTAALRKKEIALLAFLAVTKEAVLRESAVTLLWGDLGEDEAKHNLRVALNKIDASLPGAIVKHGRRLIALAEPVLHQADVWQFERLFRSRGFEAANILYRGALLESLDLKNAETFEEWLREQREVYRRWALACIGALMKEADVGRDSEALERHARRSLSLDPFREDTYRHLMLALGRKSQYSEALRVYRECAAMLAGEFGHPPAAETMAVHERIHLARALPRRDLPFHAATFVGREREVAEATAMLLRPDCRLLTFLGPGGTGKTRLAIELARRNRALFLHDMCYVPLESRSAAVSRESVLDALAGALGLPTTANRLLEDVLDYLRPRELLIVLDNFEPFVPVAALLNDIVTNAPDVKLLVTSREMLSVLNESIYHVGGLVYPPDEGPPLLPSGDAVGGDPYDALAFFARVAGRLDAGFDLAANRDGVSRICRLVEGLPLALEMIAPWTLTMSSAAIADRIAADMSNLIAYERNFPERHRSLHAVFEHSWSRLMPREQECLRRLAVIAGSISIEAAQSIAGATELVLRRLVAQSILEVPDEGRYSLHPLVRAYALDKLVNAGELNEISAKHFDYFGHYVESRVPELYGAGQIVALRQMEEQFANIRAAWRYGAEHTPADVLEILADGIIRLCRARTWYGIGIEVLQEGVEPLARRGEEYLRDRMLLQQGLMHYHLGNYEAAQSYVQVGSRANDRRLEAQALFLRASILYDQNRYDEAEPLLLRSLELNQLNEAVEAAGVALNRLGNLSILRTFFSPAGKIPYKPPRAFVNEHRWPTSNQKAGIEAAIRYYEQSLSYFIRAGSLDGIAQGRGAIGLAHFILHDYEAAADAFAEAARQFGQLDSAVEEADRFMWLAWARHHQGKAQEARLVFHQALRLGLRASAYKGLLDCLQKYSLQVWSADKQHFIPLAINAFVVQHPNTGERMRVVAQEWVENISDFMREDEGQEAVEKALAFGRSQTLTSMVHYLVPDM